MSSEPSDALSAALLEIERLRSLVEASKLINSSIEGRALYESILQVARENLGVERGTVYFVDEARKEIRATIMPESGLTEIRLPIGQGLAGTVAATGESIIIHDAYSDSRFDRTSDQSTGYRTQSVLCVPIRNRGQKIVGVLQLLNKRDGRFGKSDLDFLESISDHMAIAMENAMLHVTLIQKNRMEQELKLGREIQAQLLPDTPTDIPGTEIFARSRSCYQVGGDYFDFIPLDNEELGVALGDVSGKGVSAALIMSGVQAALRGSAPLAADLPSLMAHLNDILYKVTRAKKYVTLFFARYHPPSGTLRYVNAGHNPAIIVMNGGQELLHSTGRPIGMMKQSRYEERAVQLEPGATLFLYTDGCTDAANPAEEELGMERWCQAVQKRAGEPVANVIDSLMQDVSAFENGADPVDDKTLVVLRRSGNVIPRA